MEVLVTEKHRLMFCLFIYSKYRLRVDILTSKDMQNILLRIFQYITVYYITNKVFLCVKISPKRNEQTVLYTLSSNLTDHINDYKSHDTWKNESIARVEFSSSC